MPGTPPATTKALPTFGSAGFGSAGERLPSPDVAHLVQVLPDFLRTRRWFGGKARRLERVSVVDTASLPGASAALMIVRLEYRTAPSERYLLLPAFAGGGEARSLRRERPEAVIIPARGADGSAGVLYDAPDHPPVAAALLDVFRTGRRLRGGKGSWVGEATPAYSRRGTPGVLSLTPARVGGEQSNTSIRYGRRFILKLLRRLEEGIHPDLEIGRYLTARDFPNIPAVAGWLEYRHAQGRPTAAAILQEFIPNRGDAWALAQEELDRYFIRARRWRHTDRPPVSARHLLLLAGSPLPPLARRRISDFLQAAALLGRRTAELHVALAAGEAEPAFRPEPFTAARRRDLVRTMNRQARRVFALLREGRRADPARSEIAWLLGMEPAIRRRFARVAARPIRTQCIRGHGDYHLGQVLAADGDFIILDFEGEPARPLAERRRKHPALRDVAGMLRSFHYAAYAGLRRAGDPTEQRRLENWAHFWYLWSAVAFLRSYLRRAQRGGVLPSRPDEREVLLEAYLLEKAVYEVGYELNNRPDWLAIPSRGVAELVEAPPPGSPW